MTIRSKPASQEYRNNFDNIFRKPRDGQPDPAITHKEPAKRPAHKVLIFAIIPIPMTDCLKRWVTGVIASLNDISKVRVLPYLKR